MTGLLDSLGLDKVEADPNALPDGKYPAEVFKSEYLFHKGKLPDGSRSPEKNTISHVITYRVTDGDRAGAQKAEFFEIGVDPVRDDEGNLVSITPTMTEQQKPWYKKRWVDLGVAEADIPNAKPEDLVGTKITLGVKKNGAYTNVNFVELREGGNSDGDASVGSIMGNL